MPFAEKSAVSSTSHTIISFEVLRVMLQGDVLSAVLTIFVLLTELAHPSLEGPAFKLQACTSTIAAGALFMIVLQRER